MGEHQRGAGLAGRGLPQHERPPGADQRAGRAVPSRAADPPAGRRQWQRPVAFVGLPGPGICAKKILEFTMKRALFLTLIGLAVLPVRESRAADKDENVATFFMGRIKYASNSGNDCSNVGEDLMKLVSQASTIRVQEER